jgi:GH25 family lysozyme M1 (1,4-beta-N-acetylmuramidase)
MKRLGMLIALSAVAGCSTSPGPNTGSVRRELNVCAAGPTLQGIDVSKWQGVIDWDQVAAAGIEFAFIRVSDGTGTYDSQFQRNWSEARRVGIIRGVYQFFRPNQDPIAQANLLINEIGGAMAPGDLPPVIDVEVGGGMSKSQVIARMGDWLDRVETALGVTPIIYTSPGVWDNYVNSTAFANYPLWVAHYYVSCPRMPDGWTDWEFHQYTDSGQVAGIGGSSVDRNVFNGTLADLQALTWGDPVCGDGVCNGSEDHATCPGDCPICEPIPAQGRVVDENEVCLEWGGDSQYWRAEQAGWDNELTWTYAVSSQVYNYAVWNLTFDQAGRYRLEAYTAAPWAQSEHAKYQVRHDGGSTTVEVDQSAADGWTVVGEFDFAAGADQWVRLEDLTGEPSSSQTRVVVDAIRLTPVPPDPGGCQPVPASGRVVDETEECFEAGGDPQYWRTEQDGWDNALLWTYAVSSRVYNYGIWNLTFDQGGWYRLEAYTASPWAGSKHAKYQVLHDGNTSVREVDQTVVNGWTMVGEFEFAAGADQWVRLEDLTGEHSSTRTRVVVDAIRLTPVTQSTGCAVIPRNGRVVDETEGCFEAGGDPQWWRSEEGGWDGSLMWTHAVSSQAYNYGIWHLTFEFGGEYRLEVYTPSPWAESEHAKYQVRHDGVTTVEEVDQSAHDGWTVVGVFEFAPGGGQWVRLEDLTGEPLSTHTKVAVDAIRLTWMDNSIGGGADDDPPHGPNRVEGELSCSAGRLGSNSGISWWLLLALALLPLAFRRRRNGA